MKPLFLAVVLALLSTLPAHAQSHLPPGLLIGDSVAVNAAPYLAKDNIRTDASVSRQFAVYNAEAGQSGILEARALEAEHRLPRAVIIELGTNGPFTLADVQAMMGALSAVPHVYFVTCYVAPWESESPAKTWCGKGTAYGVNLTLAQARARWHRIHLIRWDLIAPGLVGPDGIHPTFAGAQRLARLINGITLKYGRR